MNIEYWDISGKDAESNEDDDGTPPRAFPPVEAAAIAIRELQGRKRDNLLAFLPTEKEINELHRELERDMGRRLRHPAPLQPPGAGGSEEGLRRKR